MNPGQLQEVRRCGRLETYSTARHHLGFYNNVGLTATYTKSKDLKGSLENFVFAALHHVIAAQPNLSIIPINEAKSYPDVYFARLPEIDLRTCVEFRNRESPIPRGEEADDELDKLLREQHSRGFKGDVKSRPYWRLVISSSPKTAGTFSASWIFHHALSDGSSSMLFHQSFLEGLNASMNLDSASPVVTAPSTPPLPPLEELHPMTLSWSFFLSAIADSLLPSYFAPRSPNLWTGCSVEATAERPRTPHSATVFLSAETTRLFASKCRSQNTTVTAALITLLAAVLQSTSAPGKELKIDIPISLRPFLSIPETQMVNAITTHAHTFRDPSSTLSDGDTLAYFSWPTAREVKKALVSEVGNKGADNPIALLKYVSDMLGYFNAMLGRPRSSSAEVSSLGVWRGRTVVSSDPDADAGAGVRAGAAKGWEISRMVFSQSANLTAPPVNCSAVTGGDGCLALSFNWTGQGLEEEVLERVPIAMKERIERLVLD